MAQHVDLVAHNRIDADQQILKGDSFLDPVGIAVNSMFAIARKIKDGLAHRLAGNRSNVDADAAHDRVALDHDDSLAEFGALNRRVMAGRTGTDDRKVKVEVKHRKSRALCDLT